MICNLCPRRCNAIRTDIHSTGFCGALDTVTVALVAPHKFEEPCISGKSGCGAVFFSGCTLKCVYCQNYEISHKNQGKNITVKELSEKLYELEKSGVETIEFVSATHYADKIIQALDIYRPKVPIIYNSSGYENTQTLEMLKGYIDVYLPDFKYSDDSLSLCYSGVNNYTQVATSAINEMLSQTGSPVFNDRGIIQSGVIIRHLVLPSHTKNSIGVLDIIKEQFGTQTLVSLMGQYTPYGKAENYPKINRKITQREYNKVLQYMLDTGLDGFAQELSSASTKYIPKWDI